MNRAIHRLIILFVVVLAGGAAAQSKDVVLRLTYLVTGEKRALLRLPESVKDREAFADAVAGVLGIKRAGVTDGADEIAGERDRGLRVAGGISNREGLVLLDEI